jgi:hypothetical protein
MRCNALRCTGCDARIVCDAMRYAGWLHSRGAGGAMLFSYAIEGFFGWDGWPEDGWAEGWVEEWVDRWAVCEVWVSGG